MAERPKDVDPRAWNAALDWIFEIDRRPGDASLKAQLEDWLRMHHSHRKAWEEARLIWSLAPLMRPTTSALWLGRRHSRTVRRVLAAGLAAAVLVLAVAVVMQTDLSLRE